ncbi:MAG TPA: hypothetical protein VFT28_13190 [Gemmatimonadales bacterium]|nr:hypothetical protein [Gemmatimonadales bacterium]
MIASPEPSPLHQTIVYMVGILSGYALLTPRQEWARAWRTVRTIWSGRR